MCGYQCPSLELLMSEVPGRAVPYQDFVNSFTIIHAMLDRILMLRKRYPFGFCDRQAIIC
jgi:hypothetical protein